MNSTTFGMLLDCSGSTSEPMDGMTRIEAIQEAAAATIIDLAAHKPKCLVWLGCFNCEFELLAPPQAVEAGKSNFLRAISGLEAGGGTAFDRALQGAESVLLRSPLGLGGGVGFLIQRFGDFLMGPSIADAPRSEKNLLLFLSDGHHNGSQDPISVAKRLKCLGVEIHTVGVGNTPDEVDEGTLKGIASKDEETRQPFYRFIKEVRLLAQHFVETAQGIVVRV